ncbi:MAG: FAD:protein FMN transferase [Gemmatimonadales bacterium]|nr:FAD:protein FMN transferase [Gemmatimonadales bacterium]
MGTVAHCDLELPPRLTAAESESMVLAVYDSVNSVFSTWQTDSELSRLNNFPADSALTVSPWLWECLTAADRLHTLSNGAFDPTAEPLMRLWGFYRRQGTLPGKAELDSVLNLLGNWEFTASGKVVKATENTCFDLGGIAKGFAVDQAALRLEEAGVTNGLIDLGGNLFCLGGAPGRADWRVGIRDPLDRDRYFASVSVTECGVSTSGSYERFVTINGHRYGHIMNPTTGQPAEGILSTTVFAPTALLADGLSTALFVLGVDRSRKLMAELDEPIEAILVVPGQDKGKARVLITPGLENKVTLLPEYAESYELTLW